MYHQITKSSLTEEKGKMYIFISHLRKLLAQWFSLLRQKDTELLKLGQLLLLQICFKSYYKAGQNYYKSGQKIKSVCD